MTKRIMVSPKRSEITLVSGTDFLMSRALSILHKEIDNLERATSVRYLDEKEARKLQGYIKCIVDLSKERREIEKDMDLGDMPKEQAIAYLRGMLEKLSGDGNDRSEVK